MKESDSKNELDALKDELKELTDKVKKAQSEVADKTLSDICNGMDGVPKTQLHLKKLLKGHISKVNAVHFAGDSRHCVSGSLDGKLIIWDTWTGNKVQVIPLRSSWVMTASFASSGNMVACGGMDNMCTIYDLNSKDSTGVAKICREIAGFEGFLSCCRFIDDKKLITGSADTKIILWDVDTGAKIEEFVGHSGDVISMSLHSDNNTFLTGSVDQSIKIWDIREGKCTQTFWGHESDVNSVCYHTSGFYFGTASDDKSARLFDIRADQQIGIYKAPTPSSLTSCALSNSGRLILCGSDDSMVHIWDTVTAEENCCLTGHENRVTSLTKADNGMAIVTGSWDTTVRLWN